MEHVWVQSTTAEYLMRGRGADLWKCRHCGCAVRSFKDPVEQAIEDGALKETEVPAECEYALVLNVMTS